MPRIPQIVDFSRYNIAEIDGYMMVATEPPLLDPTDEMQPKLCEESSATLEPTFSLRDSWLPH